FTYAAGAIVATGHDTATDTASVREYVPSARPGARVPHAWFMRDGVRLSTLDLFACDRFTLVAGPAGAAWVAAAAAAGVPIGCVLLGRDLVDADGHWMKLLEIEAGGAVLVRPDQHVAWRTPHGVDNHAEALARVLDHILSRPVTDARRPSSARAQ